MEFQVQTRIATFFPRCKCLLEYVLATREIKKIKKFGTLYLNTPVTQDF